MLEAAMTPLLHVAGLYKRFPLSASGTLGCFLPLGRCRRRPETSRRLLRQRGIANLILTGITTDVCVHTTMREANDRGYKCLLLTDCCGATDRSNHEAAIKMITMQGGVFGAVAPSAALLTGLL
jgi:hypothetical protein